MSGPDPRAALRALHLIWPDTRVDSRPRTPLSVGLVYLASVYIYRYLDNPAAFSKGHGPM